MGTGVGGGTSERVQYEDVLEGCPTLYYSCLKTLSCGVWMRNLVILLGKLVAVVARILYFKDVDNDPFPCVERRLFYYLLFIFFFNF